MGNFKQTPEQLGDTYPKTFAMLRQGDIDITDTQIAEDLERAGIPEADLPLMEQAIIGNSMLLTDGMPFPGDDEKFDALVDSDKGLQLLQKFYDYWG